MSTLWRIEDEALKLHFHAAQLEAWDSQRRFIFLIAGSQSGKTSFSPWWLWREIQRCGSGDYLAVTATYDLYKLKFLPEIRQVFETLLGEGRYWSGDQVMELKDPVSGKFLAKTAAEVLVELGMENGADVFEGEAFFNRLPGQGAQDIIRLVSVQLDTRKPKRIDQLPDPAHLRAEILGHLRPRGFVV